MRFVRALARGRIAGGRRSLAISDWVCRRHVQAGVKDELAGVGDGAVVVVADEGGDVEAAAVEEVDGFVAIEIARGPGGLAVFDGPAGAEGPGAGHVKSGTGGGAGGQRSGGRAP